MLLSAWIFTIYPPVPQPLGFTVTPYNNTTQSGYHIINISTYGKTTLPIGNPNITLQQNYIAPNESGVTLNGRPYYLALGKPQKVYGQSGIYVELVRVLYIPRLDMVDFNIYSNVSGILPTTTATSTVIATTTSIGTTTILPTTTTSTSLSTTTAAYGQSNVSSNPISSIINQIVEFIKKLFG